MRALPLALLAALPLAGSCLTTQEVNLFGGQKLEAVHIVPTQAWRAVVGGDEIGYVVLMEALGDDGRHYFSVRNVWNQELGMVDSLGRSWRFAAHAEEAEWLGSGAVSDGAGLVLGAAGHCRLEEVPLERISGSRPPADR